MRTEKEVKEKKLELVESFIDIDNTEQYSLTKLKTMVKVLNWILGKDWPKSINIKSKGEGGRPISIK